MPTTVWNLKVRLGLFALASATLCAVTLPPATAQTDDLHLKLERQLTFVDGRDEPVTTAQFEGKWLLVYFGYMHCADQCPWGLTVLGSALDMLGPAARHVQPLFITVDPERDRGKALIDFAASFHETLKGLTGTEAEIRSAATAMGVTYSRVQQGADYSVDHSSSYSLVDPERRTVITFRKAEASQVASKVVEVLTRAGVKLDGLRGVGAWR